MDARLEAVILDALDRFGGRAAIDETELRGAYPDHWRDVRDFLRFEARVADGAPEGARAGPYRLLRRLGRGGAGTVYLAAAADGARVAVKVIHAHLAARPEFVERALAEARAAAVLDHPNVVRILDAGTEQSSGPPTAYVVTEYVEGQNLRGLITELGPIAEPLVRHLAAEVLRGLGAIHAAGAVHGDLKPENVLVTPGEVVKIVDVGLAAPLASPDGGARAFRGTPHYAAPEQFLAAGGDVVDGRADLFALGMIVEEMLAGAHPLGDRRPETPTRRASAFLRSFAATLRAPAPRDRFATAGDALTVLVAGEASPWWTARAGGKTADTIDDAAWANAGARRTSLHGRERELDSLRAFVTDAAPGAGRIALVAGDAGVGKSRLVEELAAGVRRRGSGVLWWAFGDESPAAGVLATELRDALAAAGGRPVLLVADDLHAADDAVIAGLRRLVVDADGGRVALVATSRPARAAAVRGALDVGAVVELADLPVEAVRALLADTLGSDTLGDELGLEVHRRTDGNPLAVLEMLDALRDADVLVRDASGGWTLRWAVDRVGVSVTAREILALRLAALPRADADILEMAACLGMRFEPDLVARSLGIDVGRVLLRLARLERRHHAVRRAGDGMAFEHHEVRDAVLAATSAARTREVHAALAAAVEARASERGSLAAPERRLLVRHALRGHDGTRAAPHLVAALGALLDSGRPAEVVELATAGLGVAGAVRAGDASAVLVLRGRSRFHTDDVAGGIADFDEAACRAREAGDDSGARECALLALQGRAMQGRVAESCAAAGRLLEECVAAGDAPAADQARLTLAITLMRLARPEDALPHLRHCAESASRRGPSAESAEARLHLAQAIGETGRPVESLDELAVALAFLRTAGAPVTLVWTLGGRAAALTMLGRRSEAVEAVDEAARLARSVGDGAMEGASRAFQAELLRCLGRPGEAAALHERVRQLAARGFAPGNECQLVRWHAHLLLGDGRTAEALAEFERCRDLAIRGERVAMRLFASIAIAGIHARWRDERCVRAALDDAQSVAVETRSPRLLAFAAEASGAWGGTNCGPDPSALRTCLALLADLDLPEFHASVALRCARFDAVEHRLDDAVRHALAARRELAGCEAPNLHLTCDALLAALGASDPAPVSARLATEWDTYELFTRVEAAGLLGQAALFGRARADTDFAAGHAPPEHVGALRASLERDLAGLKADR